MDCKIMPFVFRENLTFTVPTTSELPPISMKRPMKFDPVDKAGAAGGDVAGDGVDSADGVDFSILEDEEDEIDQFLNEKPVDDQSKRKEQIDRVDDEAVDPLDDILDSSSNEGTDNGQEADPEDPEENEDLKRMELMNATMERLRLQTSEFEKLKKESPTESANTSQAATEYEDDFGSDELEELDLGDGDGGGQGKDAEHGEDPDEINSIDLDIEEDIDEDIGLDAVSESVSNATDENKMYSVKVSSSKHGDALLLLDLVEHEQDEKDPAVTEQFNLEQVAGIIMNVETDKIRFQC